MLYTHWTCINAKYSENKKGWNWLLSTWIISKRYSQHFKGNHLLQFADHFPSRVYWLGLISVTTIKARKIPKAWLSGNYAIHNCDTFVLKKMYWNSFVTEFTVTLNINNWPRPISDRQCSRLRLVKFWPWPVNVNSFLFWSWLAKLPQQFICLIWFHGTQNMTNSSKEINIWGEKISSDNLPKKLDVCLRTSLCILSTLYCHISSS